MSKIGKTRDELIRDFGQGTAPPNSFAGAATAGFSTFPVDDVGANNATPVYPNVSHNERPREYVAPPSNLPMQVTQGESARHNCEWQAQTPWDSEGEAAPILAGTRSGTPSATPKSPARTIGGGR